jgi:F0F1-type ATP synthase membrane subunit b/b'
MAKDKSRVAGTPMDLEIKLNMLEAMVREAKTVPLSASIMLNKSELESLVAELLASTPDQVRQARNIVQERDGILEQARAEARRLVEEAKAERELRISRTEVIQAANREADRIVQEARDQARSIRLEAEDYVDAKLANFEVVLHKTLGAVERGREKLRGRMDHDALAGVSEELAEDRVASQDI